MRATFILFNVFLFSSPSSVIYGRPLHAKPLTSESDIKAAANQVVDYGTSASLPDSKGRVKDLQINFARGRGSKPKSSTSSKPNRKSDSDESTEQSYYPTIPFSVAGTPVRPPPRPSTWERFKKNINAGLTKLGFRPSGDRRT